MKKLISVVLTLVLMLSFTTSVFASESKITKKMGLKWKLLMTPKNTKK